MSNNNINDILDQLFAGQSVNLSNPQQSTPKPTPQNNNGFKDISSQQILTHITKKQLGSIGNPTTNQMVKLNSGHAFYRPINVQGWPAKTPICKTGGIIPENTPEFEYKGEVKVICVDGINSLDFSKIDESNTKTITLVEVSSLWQGKILVPKEAISFGSNGNKKILLG